MNYDRLILGLYDEVETLKNRIAVLEEKLATKPEESEPFSYNLPVSQPVPSVPPVPTANLSFEAYLRSVRGLNNRTIKARCSNCNRLKRYMDVDAGYATDHCVQLLKNMEYTSEEARQGIPPAHGIPIEGDVYKGTATLRQALHLYIDFLDYCHQANSDGFTS